LKRKNKQATVTGGSKGPGLAIVEAAFGARSGGSFAFRPDVTGVWLFCFDTKEI
jgi:hypothetical protein